MGYIIKKTNEEIEAILNGSLNLLFLNEIEWKPNLKGNTLYFMIDSTNQVVATCEVKDILDFEVKKEEEKKTQVLNAKQPLLGVEDDDVSVKLLQAMLPCYEKWRTLHLECHDIWQYSVAIGYAADEEKAILHQHGWRYALILINPVKLKEEVASGLFYDLDKLQKKYHEVKVMCYRRHGVSCYQCDRIGRCIYSSLQTFLPSCFLLNKPENYQQVYPVYEI